MNGIRHFYDTHYKVLLLVPFLIFIASLLIIGAYWAKTGDIIPKGISLKGGSSFTIQLQKEVDVSAFTLSLLVAFPTEDIAVRSLATAGKITGVIVDTTATETTSLKAFLEQQLPVASLTLETVGPALGASFFKQAVYSVLIAFVLMSIVVLLYFRSLIPSSYVILAVICNMCFVWAMLILLDVKVSTAGIAAFLMLIGYSVDTDILLTTRVLRREGAVFDKTIDAFRTGMVMTLAAMVATSVAYFATSSEVLKQIMLILFLGLVADVWNTWLQNAGLLRLYVESKHKRDAQ